MQTRIYDQPGRPVESYDARAGFHCSTAVDNSEAALRQMRLAVARAKEGDNEAMRFLYLRYRHNIYGYVRSIVRDDYEAEDVTQHVFAKVLTSLDKYDERGVPFLAWLLRLARNVAIDHLRANRFTTAVETVHESDPGTQLDVDYSLCVREALQALPPDQREVVLLRHVVGLSPGEIADRLGRTEGSIHGLHHRGRRTLQHEFSRLELGPLTRSLAAAPKG